MQTNRVRVAAYTVTAIWSLAILLAGLQLPDIWSTVLTAVPLLVVGGFALFDNVLWHIGPLKKVVRRPQLNGTWRGTLTSLRDGASGEVEHDPIPIYITVWQSYLTLNICLLSAESKSRSIASHIAMTEPNNFVVHYHYSNLPGMRVRDRSPAHAGGARLDISTVTPSVLRGEYWSDRRTRGTFQVEKASKKQYGDWSEALAALGGGS